MPERNEPPSARDLDVHFKVKQAEVDDTLADPEGAEHVRDDIRLGGTIEDAGPQADPNAPHIGDISEDSRDEVERIADSNRDGVEGAADSNSGRGDSAANGAEGEH